MNSKNLGLKKILEEDNALKIEFHLLEDLCLRRAKKYEASQIKRLNRFLYLAREMQIVKEKGYGEQRIMEHLAEKLKEEYGKDYKEERIKGFLREMTHYIRDRNDAGKGKNSKHHPHVVPICRLNFFEKTVGALKGYAR